MILFIRLKNGAPFEHPILEDNFKEAFPHIDAENLPPEFMRFERLPPPALDIYEVYEGVTYEIVGGVCKDVHHVRPMTAEEREAKDALLAARPKPSFLKQEQNA